MCGYANNRGVVRNILRDNSSGSDNGSAPHGHSGQNDGVYADIGSGADANRGYLEIGLNDRDAARQTGVLGTQNLCARPPTNTIFDYKVSSVKIALRADPHSVSDHTPAIESALDNRLFADKHAMADLKRFGMYNGHVRA